MSSYTRTPLLEVAVVVDSIALAFVELASAERVSIVLVPASVVATGIGVFVL